MLLALAADQVYDSTPRQWGWQWIRAKSLRAGLACPAIQRRAAPLHGAVQLLPPLRRRLR